MAKSNKYIRKYFLGTFPADVKPRYQNKKVCCWIWNTEESDHKGEHWVAMFKNHYRLFFFDSFGKSLQFYNRTYWIDQQLQSEISIFCGAFITWMKSLNVEFSLKKIRQPTLLNNLFFKT